MKLRFGEFWLDTEARQLCRGSENLHLTPKAFDLLTILARSRPKAVSKTELHEQLWPATFVNEANLANLIAEIRDVLDDSSARPRFIRTVHRFGYAFVADVDSKSSHPRSRLAGEVVCWLISGTRKFALDAGEHLVGRAPDVAVVLDYASVSRHHARIVVTNQRATIEDLGSKNGTWVAGTRITEPTALADGDEIKFGTARVKFRSWSTLGSTRTPTSKMDR